MKKFFINIYYYLNVFFDLFIAYVVNICSKISRKKNNHNYILVYAPYRYKPWILNKIIDDLKNSSDNKEKYKIFKSISKLSLFRFYNGGDIFLMHQSLIRKFRITGFDLKEISAFYTHTQINQKGIENIRKLKKIFCLNNYEYALLNSSGINSDKLVNFPVGINSNFIDNKYIKNIEEREIDVLFSLRYFVKNNHYKIRKRYEFIITLANLLIDCNLNVCILGEGWEEIEKSLNKNIKVLNIKYSQYPSIYKDTKVYCNPSLVEGGPTSLIEAFACGCIIFTSPIGLSFNLCLEDKLSYLMPFDVNEVYWKNNILKLLSNNIDEYHKILSSRDQKIRESLFKNLSRKLENNIK